MTRDERKNNRESHDANSLYAEWPTPADVVECFGGNPDKVAHKQWKMENDLPGAT